MGILDQLNKEADDKREAEYQHSLLPTMHKIFATLKALLDYLNPLGAIEIKDYSSSMPQIGTLKQGGYKINTDGVGGFAEQNNLRQINLLYKLIGHDTFSYTMQGKLAGEQEADKLRSKNLNVETKTFISERGIPSTTFTIERNFLAMVKFEVDYDNSKIKLFIGNHENLTSIRNSFAASDITDEFLDEFVRYFIRKDRVFVARMGKRATF